MRTCQIKTMLVYLGGSVPHNYKLGGARFVKAKRTFVVIGKTTCLIDQLFQQISGVVCC